VALLGLALVPGYVWASQAHLDNASYLFARHDCVGARAAALSSISALGDRGEPYQIVGYCDIRLGRPRAALAAMDKAVSLDPGNWSYALGLALATAATGRDPRDAARRAVSLNPRDPLAQGAWQILRTAGPARWRAEGRALAGRLRTL
jgi:Flp pilus assembly protein TadD